MRREIASSADLDEVAAAWAGDSGFGASLAIAPARTSPSLQVEDVPRIEDLGSIAIEWVVKNLIAVGTVSVITGAPGCGKSTFVSALAGAVSVGDAFIGRATSRRPVLILDAENPLPVVVERFGRLRIRTHAGLIVWGQWVGEEPPAVGGMTVIEWIQRCEDPPLIVIDSLIAFGRGVDENSSNAMREYLAQYRTAASMGATVVILHHVGKGETSADYRGSSDLPAAVDVAYKLTNLGDPARLDQLELRPFKQRITVSSRVEISYADGVFSEETLIDRKSVTERLTDLLIEHPERTSREFEHLAAERGLGRNQARTFLVSGVLSGTIQRSLGVGRRRGYRWLGTGSGLHVVN